MVDEKRLSEMDKEANKVIGGWSFGALAANLLPPPFDLMAVGTVFARLGTRLGEVYGVTINWRDVKKIGMSMAKGLAAVAGAAYIGTSLFKYIPGVNIWVALLIQPPIVGAIAYSVGNAFKQYYRIRLTEGRDLTPEQMRELAEALLKEKLV